MAGYARSNPGKSSEWLDRTGAKEPNQIDGFEDWSDIMRWFGNEERCL